MLRIILIIIVLAMSLLVLFPAPTNLLWYVAIMVSEFPWIFMALLTGLFFWSLKADRYHTIGMVLTAVTFLIFLYPVISAYTTGSKLKQLLTTPENEHMSADGLHQEKPFSFWHMMSGIGVASVAYTTYPYTHADGQSITIDFYKAQASGNRPCVIVVHGGSWTGGTSQQLPEINWYLAKQGYNVASINYRMAPQYTSPAQVDDTREAIRYLKNRAAELKIDTSNLVLLGRSAGGQIVLTAAYSFNDPDIKGVVSFYAPADMIWSYEHPSNPLVLNTCKVLRDFLGGSDKEVSQKYIDASPVSYVNPRSTPTLLIHGKNDVLVSYEQSERLDKVLTENKVPHIMLDLPWATHGCEYTLNGPSGQLSVYAIERFLRKVTSGK
jgi:acetyl esterase/lipase